MPEETDSTVTVRVEQLVTALTNIQNWCGVVRDALMGLDPKMEIQVTQSVQDAILKGPPQGAGIC